MNNKLMVQSIRWGKRKHLTRSKALIRNSYLLKRC